MRNTTRLLIILLSFVDVMVLLDDYISGILSSFSERFFYKYHYHLVSPKVDTAPHTIFGFVFLLNEHDI